MFSVKNTTLLTSNDGKDLNKSLEAGKREKLNQQTTAYLASIINLATLRSWFLYTVSSAAICLIKGIGIKIMFIYLQISFRLDLQADYKYYN